ncbi:hypothetical protein HN803_03165 [candidate division WWE3 bacterium]|jgi:hypothetical protein|nr:hypothetical protein [Candidatus Scalindua sp.]MBT7349772.1 hypothetical protein [candidate division WWE3 bacterium]
MSDKRKSKVSKSIKRIYNVAQYESLELVVHYEEEIEWETVAERQKKADNISKLLLNDFKKTRLDVFNELNASEKKAYFKNLLKSMGDVSEEDLLGQIEG